MDSTSPLTCCCQCAKSIGRGTSRKRLFCSSCLGVAYCSPICQTQHWANHKEDCRYVAFHRGNNEAHALSHRNIVALEREFESFVDQTCGLVFKVLEILLRSAIKRLPIDAATRCPYIFRLGFAHDPSAPADEPRRRFRLLSYQACRRADYPKLQRKRFSSEDNDRFMSDEDVARRLPPVVGESQVDVAIEYTLPADPEVVPNFLFVTGDHMGQAQAWKMEPGAEQRLYDLLKRSLEGTEPS